MLIDHHCHLDSPQILNQRDQIITRAKNAGVGVIVTISTQINNLGVLLEIVDEHENVFCSVGTHPQYAEEELGISLSEIITLSQHPKVVAIGESGLDMFNAKSSPESQESSFRQHIAAARKTGLPIEMHIRDADQRAICILQEEYAKGPFKAILHCFTGSQKLAMSALDLGFYISFTGIITFKNSDKLRVAATQIPINKLLIESDAPYLTPTPHRGKTNEPAFINHTAQVLAEVKGLSFEEIANATTNNFFRLFQKVPRHLAKRSQ